MPGLFVEVSEMVKQALDLTDLPQALQDRVKYDPATSIL